MNVIVLNNGDTQLADYKFRINKEYTTVSFAITERCNFRCSYCMQAHSDERDTLTDKYPVEEIVDHFRYLQENSGKKLYVWLTGGEPSLVTNFGELVRGLTGYMDIELETNLCTKYIKDFAENADPKRVGQVVASYHGETIDKNERLRKLYFENFRLLMERVFTVVCKIIALPEEIPHLKDKVAWLKRQLPDEAIIFVHTLISGEIGPKEHPTSYLYLYTEEEKRILQEVMQVRRVELFDYINGAGYFQGMKCDAGRGIIVIDKNGDAFRCWSNTIYGRIPLGNLIKRNIHLLDAPKPCPAPYCQCTPWALWYGVNPWDYIGKKAQDCQYCRFAPLHLSEEKSSLNSVEETKLYGNDRPDIPLMRKKVIDHINTFRAETATRRVIAKDYLRWANMLNSAKNYECAKKYALKSFFLNLQTLPLLAILFVPEKVVKGIRKSKRILLKIAKKFREDFDL